MALIRLLSERGLSEDEIDLGISYVEVIGAPTMKEAYVLAMSRVLYSDDELAAGVRFRFEQPAPLVAG